MSKRVVLITGCSDGGLGSELAKQYHSEGLRVIATARNISSMSSLSSLGIETFTLDISDINSVQALRDWLSETTGGKLHILVNNAGIAYPFSVADMDMTRVKEVFEVNLFGAMLMVKTFLPMLLVCASEDARVVHIGSLAGVMPVPFGPAYNASKAALHSYADTLRVELAPFKIKVITILAGLMETKIGPKPGNILPADSIYSPIRDHYQSRRVIHFQDGATPRHVAAKQIINETLKRNPKAWLWLGRNSWTCWFLSTFGGRRVFDRIVSRIFGLDRLARLLRSQNKDA
ncbi:hypothetical protein C8J56DRAFT_930571 [Mycena floridula]|nr:hypothetical protein C8J56DRAFT_930543 [Mycena floridula]KAJ7593212.1 hypothetical protein C8J56DRAFT_930571 [Mycena floridula]